MSQVVRYDLARARAHTLPLDTSSTHLLPSLGARECASARSFMSDNLGWAYILSRLQRANTRIYLYVHAERTPVE